jgi:hypothetical protein
MTKGKEIKTMCWKPENKDKFEPKKKNTESKQNLHEHKGDGCKVWDNEDEHKV